VKIVPGVPKAKVKSRIIVTPQHAKRLFRALKDNIVKYESMHGEIDIPEAPDIPFNLGKPQGEA
jgi:hypothetical protein